MMFVRQQSSGHGRVGSGQAVARTPISFGGEIDDVTCETSLSDAGTMPDWTLAE
jgi:hypothetical protein